MDYKIDLSERLWCKLLRCLWWIFALNIQVLGLSRTLRHVPEHNAVMLRSEGEATKRLFSEEEGKVSCVTH
jgi:hypothetical protein